VKISNAVIEILIFNKRSSKVYRFRKYAFFRSTLHDVSINAIVAVANQKQNGVQVFSTEDLVLIEVLRQEKRYNN